MNSKLSLTLEERPFVWMFDGLKALLELAEKYEISEALGLELGANELFLGIWIDWLESELSGDCKWFTLILFSTAVTRPLR